MSGNQRGAVLVWINMLTITVSTMTDTTFGKWWGLGWMLPCLIWMAGDE